jgi:hypothetical protein
LDIFVEILEKVHIVGTLPSEDGLRGEGYIKLSDFGECDNIVEAFRVFTILYN